MKLARWVALFNLEVGANRRRDLVYHYTIYLAHLVIHPAVAAR